MHVAPQGFTVSGPQKLLGCTVGAAVPNPNPPAGASRSRACPAVPARGPWVRLVTQCDAKNRISPDSQLSAPKLPAPPHAATANKKEVLRVAKHLLSFLLKSPAALAIAAAPEAREQWSLLSATRPRPSGQLRRLDAPSRAGEWFPRPPPAPDLGLSQGQAPVAWEAGEGRRYHPLFQEKPEAQSWAGSVRTSHPSSEAQSPCLLLKEKGPLLPEDPHPAQRETQPCTQEVSVLTDAAGQRQES